MEEQNPTGNIGDSETISPFPSSLTSDVHDEPGSAAQDSPTAEEKRPPLTQRLSEAFREGMASARPDGATPAAVKAPPRARGNRQEASAAGILDKVMQGDGSAVAGVGDAAVGALDSFVRFFKKTSDLTQKYTDAFREGAASVKQQAGTDQRGAAGPTAAKLKRAPMDGRAILDRVWQAGESAAGFVREAVSVVKPGEIIGARQKIRLGQKKINQLYIDIGGEAAHSWSDGLVETEKLAALLDELRKSEEEVLSVQAHLAEVAAASKTTAARRPQVLKKQAASTAATDKEDSRVDTGNSDAASGEPFDNSYNLGIYQPVVDQLEEEAFCEPVNRDDVAPNANDADISASVAPDFEVPESLIATEVNREATLPEVSDSEVEQVLPEAPEASLPEADGNARVAEEVTIPVNTKE